MAASTVKVLIAGDVNGKIESLYKRVATVNASNGPFDLLLCVGSFFPANGGDDAEHSGELLPYIDGTKKAPIPTYFIGGFGLGSKHSIEALKSAPDCGIHYLGRGGVTTLKGLNVAFLDGTYNAAAYKESEDGGSPSTSNCRYYHESDLQRLKHQLTTTDGDIDVLLVNEWPSGVCVGLPDASKPQGLSNQTEIESGSAHGAELALAARPRYLIAGGKHIFFARPPYANADLGAGSHVTRFIALGDVGNATKQKWLHALALTPASEMTQEALQTKPQGTTQCPFTAAAALKRKRDADEVDNKLDEQNWRWQQQGKRPRAPIAAPSLGRADVTKDRTKTAFVRNVPFRASEDDIVSFFSQAGKVVDVVRKANAEGRLNTYCFIQFDSVSDMERACQLNGTQLMGRDLFIEPAGPEKQHVVKPVEGCWFCLSNPNADVELVVSISEECYLASDKGAITDNHVLILPVEHYPSTQRLPPSTYAEMERYLSALRSCYASTGHQLVAFERYMKLKKSGGNHCHLNVMAIPTAAASKAKETFQSIAAKHGFALTSLPVATGEGAREALKGVVGDGEYFVAILPDGSRLVHPISYGERHPLSYGREVLAELAGVPERAEWKNCDTSNEAAGGRTERFKAKFKSYDIMQDE